MDTDITILIDTRESPEWGLGWHWRVLQGDALKAEGWEEYYSTATLRAGEEAAKHTPARMLP
jgi:hypothetical protein